MSSCKFRKLGTWNHRAGNKKIQVLCLLLKWHEIWDLGAQTMREEWKLCINLFFGTFLWTLCKKSCRDTEIFIISIFRNIYSTSKQCPHFSFQGVAFLVFDKIFSNILDLQTVVLFIFFCCLPKCRYFNIS